MDIWPAFTDWYMANVPAEVRLRHAKVTELDHCKDIAERLQRATENMIIERMEYEFGA